MVIAVAEPQPLDAGGRVATPIASPGAPLKELRPPAATSASGVPAPARPGRAAPWVWRPLAGQALLSRLRNTGRRRPAADPELVVALRSLLDESVGPAPAEVPVLTADRLDGLAACPVHPSGHPHPSGPPAPSSALACGALVAAAFRQLVVTGTVDDPVEDGLAALEVDDFQQALARWIRQLPTPQARELRAEVGRQVDDLRRRWPALAPSWMPRVGAPLRVPVAGGAVLLGGRVDLTIGRPARNEASVALVEIAAGTRRPAHADARGWLALLETMRSGVPPFVVATYFTRTGELDTDPVDAALLVSAAQRAARGIAALTGGPVPEVATGTGGCPECLRDGLLGNRDRAGGHGPVRGTESGGSRGTR